MASRTYTNLLIALGFIALLSSSLKAGLAEDVAKENALQSLLKVVNTARADDLQALSLPQIEALTKNRDRLFALKESSSSQTSRIILSFQKAEPQVIETVARSISTLEYDHFAPRITSLNRTALIEALARKSSEACDSFTDAFAHPIAALLKDPFSPLFLECLLITGAESSQPPSLLAQIVTEFNNYSPLATLIDIKVEEPTLKNFFRELFKMSPSHMQPFCRFSFTRELSSPPQDPSKKPTLPSTTSSLRTLPSSFSSSSRPDAHFPFLGPNIFQFPALVKTLGRMKPAEIQEFSEVLKTLGPQMFGTNLTIKSMTSIIDAIGSAQSPNTIREFVSTFHRPEMRLLATRLHQMFPTERTILLTRLAFLTPQQLLECAAALSKLKDKVSKDIAPQNDLTFVWLITVDPAKIKETVEDFLSMIPPKATENIKKFRAHLFRKIKDYKKSHPRDTDAAGSSAFSNWAKGTGFDDLFDEIDDGFEGEATGGNGIDDDGFDNGDFDDGDFGDDAEDDFNGGFGDDAGGGDVMGGFGDLDLNTFTQLFGTDSSMPPTRNSFPFHVFLA